MRATGLAGRRVLVTGAAGGIGQAVLRVLLEEGMQVVATDRDMAGIAPAPGLRIAPLDVTDSAAVDALVARVEAEEGPIDACASLAGILATGLVSETDDAAWRRVRLRATEHRQPS